MATLNGHLTPPPPPSSLPGDSHGTTATLSTHKRKRDDTPSNPTARDVRVQTDILDLLSRHDTEPSFLDYSFGEKEPASSVLSPSSDEPSHKKARLSNPPSATTISAKLRQCAYTTLQHLKNDANQVGNEITASLRATAKQKEDQDGRLSIEELKHVQRIRAFEDFVKRLADRELGQEPVHEPVAVGPGTEKTDQDGVGISQKSQPYSKESTVLTLFGNAPTPKQLFSSLQKVPTPLKEGSISTKLPVEEMSLPNGLSATQVVSVSSSESKGRTFAETFAHPQHLTQLHPPKSHKRSSTRDTRIEWEFKEPSQRNSKRGGYTTQVLTSSDWLSYGGVDLRDGEASPGEKRRQRDRALSGSASQPPAIKHPLHDMSAREEEALFRKVYSSFAPSCDNSKAVVTDEVKSMIWWQRIGQKRFNSTFALDPELLDEPQSELFHSEAIVEAEAGNDDDFSAIMEDLDEVYHVLESEPVRSKTDVEQVLMQISELLETLSSYQRIRNAGLQPASAGSRTPIHPVDQILTAIGKPDEPAKDEHDVYDAIRRELAYLVLKLPPYAVAKLDGDQLEDLGVSKLIRLENANTRGILEEDQVARQAKYAALTAPNGVSSAQRSSSMNQHYSSTNQRTPAIGQAANTRYGSTFASGRTPAPAFQRSTSNTSTYGTPTSRSGYSQPNQYTRQPSYGQSYQAQRTNQTSGFGTYQSSQTPVTQARSSFSTTQPLLQQRSQQAAASAVSYQTNPAYAQQQYNRNVSPAKPTGFAQNTQGSSSTTPRPPLINQQVPAGQQFPDQSYTQQPGSGRATPNYPSQPQTPINGPSAQQRIPPPVAQRATSTTPQPAALAAAPAPGQQQIQGQGQGQVNGHASTYPEPPAMEPIVQPPQMLAPGTVPDMGLLLRQSGQQRTRRPVACDSCRLRKHKCVFDGKDDGQPCENCVKYGRQCTFGGPLDSSRGGGGVSGDGRKQPRCDMCKEKKMACVYDSSPPCITCKTKGVECTFNIAGIASGNWLNTTVPSDIEAMEDVPPDLQQTSMAEMVANQGLPL